MGRKIKSKQYLYQLSKIETPKIPEEVELGAKTKENWHSLKLKLNQRTKCLSQVAEQDPQSTIVVIFRTNWKNCRPKSPNTTKPMPSRDQSKSL